MDEELAAVRKFLAQRHIVLNNEWEGNVIRFIKLNIRKVDEGVKSYNLPELVLEQWLYSDLRESTRSSLNIPANANSTNGGKPAILQLLSVVDISDSFYSQYRSKIIDLSKDDTDFHDPSENPRERVKTKHGTKDINNFFDHSPKKPMYMFEFSDGNIIIKAVATDKIYGLDSNTYLGAKILIIPKYVYRNRVIKLTSKNCQFLGGCNQRCMEENCNPLKVLCQKLGKNYEDAVLQASKSKNQLNQTMKAATILQQPQSTVFQAMKAPQPLQKPQPDVVQAVQRQHVLIQPSPKTDTSVTTLIQPLPLQKETLQPTPKKPEPRSPPKELHEGTVYISTYIIDDVKNTTTINGEMEADNASKEQSLNDSRVNLSDTFSFFSSPPKRQPPSAPAISGKNKFNAGITTKRLDDTSFILADSFFSFPSPPKYQPPKPSTVAVNNDIHDYEISDTTLNDYGSAEKSTLKSTSIQKPKQAFLKPSVTIMPPSSVQVDGFKRPLPFVRRSNNVNSSRDAASMSPPKKNPKFDNNGFKKPFLPNRKPATVQRPTSNDFVPETPAALYNSIKPSKSLLKKYMGPKKLFHTLISSSRNTQKSSDFKNELPSETKLAVAALKKERRTPPKPSFNPFSLDDTIVARDPVNNISDGNDAQMNVSNINDDNDIHMNDSIVIDDSDENRKPSENTGKSFSELLAIDSDTKFMEAIRAKKSSHAGSLLREEQSRRISALPWTPMKKSLSSLYGSQNFNINQSSDRIGNQEKSPEIDAERSEEEMEDESPAQNPILPWEYDAFNLGTSNDGIERKRNLSNRQKIHAIHCEINSGLSINKWSLLVKVSTETHPDVVLVVGKELLTSLFGITSDRLKKAMAEKNAYELDRCKENGQQMRKIFERQDLVLEVEYPSEPSSFPVIKEISNITGDFKID